MKKSNLLCGSFICLLFLSSFIGIHASIETKPMESIIGKWELTGEVSNGVPSELSDCEKKQTIEFFNNTKGEIVNELIEPCHYESVAFEYDVKEKKLILSITKGINFPVYGGKATDVPYVMYATIHVLDSKNLEFTVIGTGEKSFLKNEQVTLRYAKVKK
jgi:hypothetical protein